MGFGMSSRVRHPVQTMSNHIERVGGNPAEAAAKRAKRRVWALGACLSLLATSGAVSKVADFRQGGVKGMFTETVDDFKTAFSSEDISDGTHENSNAAETVSSVGQSEETGESANICDTSVATYTIEEGDMYVSRIVNKLNSVFSQSVPNPDTAFDRLWLEHFEADNGGIDPNAIPPELFEQGDTLNIRVLAEDPAVTGCEIG
jgi:hypothetical protein